MAEPQLEDIDLSDYAPNEEPADFQVQAKPTMGYVAPTFDAADRAFLNTLGPPVAAPVPTPRTTAPTTPPTTLDEKDQAFLKTLGPSTTPPVVPATPATGGGPIIRGDRRRIDSAISLAATLNIPFEQAYAGEESLTAKLKEKSPGILERRTADIMAGLGDVFTLSGRALSFVAPDKSEAARLAVESINYGKRLQQAYMPTAPHGEISWQNVIDPEWLATTIFRNAPVTLSLIIPTLAATAATGGTATAFGLGLFAKYALRSAGGAAVGALLESGFEAAGTYEEAKQRGKSEEEANQAAATTFKANLPLLGVSNMAELALLFTPLKMLGPYIPQILKNRVASAALKFAATSTIEPGQEIAQEMIQQYSLGDPINPISPQALESGLVALVYGWGMAGAGTVYENMVNHVESRMTPHIAENYQIYIQQELATGATETQATIKALDRIAADPGGREFIEKTFKELKDTAEGKPVEPITQEEMQSNLDKIPEITQELTPPEVIGEDVISAIETGQASVEDLFGLPAEPQISLTKEAAPSEGFGIVSEETYQAALASLKEKVSGLHAGIDPVALKDFVVIGAYHIERGVKSFVEWSGVMIERFGDTIKPHLQEIWNQASSMVERGVKSGLRTEEIKQQVRSVEGATQAAKDVKAQIQLTTGQEKLAKFIREDVALTAALQRAAQAARIAYRVGTKEATERARANFREVLIAAKVKAEQKGFAFGYKYGVTSTRQELLQAFRDQQQDAKATQKALRDVIEEELPVAERGKFLTALIGNLTKKQQTRVLDRVIEAKERLTKKALIQELGDLQHYNGDIDVNYQRQLQGIVGDINTHNFNPSTVAKLEALRNYAEDNGMPSGVSQATLSKLDAISKKQAKDMTPDELRTVIDTANHLKAMGELKQELKYKYRESERQKALDRLVEGTHSIDYKDDARISKFSQHIFLETLTPYRVSEIMDGYKRGPNSELTRSLAYADKAAQLAIHNTILTVAEEAAKLGIGELTEDQEARIMTNIRNQEGAEAATLQLMQKYGYKEIPYVTPNEQKFIDLLKKHSSAEVDKIAALYEETKNMPFVKLPDRILPLKYEGEPIAGDPTEVLLHTPYRKTQTQQGMLIERQKGVQKMPRTDVWQVFEQGINEQLWYLHMQPVLDNIAQLVKDPKYINKAGEVNSNYWKDTLDITARRGWSAKASHNAFSQGLRFFRGNISKAILGYKLSSILMQPFAIFDAMAYAQSQYGTAAAREVVQEMAKSWLVSGYAKDYMEGSANIRLRRGGELALEEVLAKLNHQKGIYNKFIRGGMDLLLKADVRTAIAAESAFEKILTKHGIPNAKEEAGILMELTQSSSDVTFRPHVLARGETARTWFNFQTFMLNRWGMISHDLVMKNIVKGDLKHKISGMVGLGIIVAATLGENEARKYIYELTTQRKIIDRSMLMDALYAIPSNVPYFGSIYDMARGRPSEIPISRIMGDLFRVLLIPGMNTSDTRTRAALRGARAAVELGAGVPGTAQAFDIVEGMLMPGKQSTKASPAGGKPKAAGQTKAAQ